MSRVAIRNLSVRFGANEVIQALDLDVHESEFLVLLGPSGCGKSTLLHSIAGLIDVSEGSIEIGGEDMTWADPTDRNIGMVFQSYALYPTMTVERNMSFGLRINGTPKAEIARRVARAADMLQLGPLLGRKPSQLSGGQRQRVAIGRALVRDAGVFLFDEPLSNLDAQLRAELRRELKLLHKHLHSTMIYVTHDQVEAMTLASRIVVMRAGKIQQIGAPAEVYARPANLFVAGFLGSPGMNFFQGRLCASGAGESPIFECGSVRVDLGSYAWASPWSAQMQAVLGVRPEDIHISAQGRWQASVSLIEPMGNHHVIWFEFAGTLCACVVSGPVALRPDDVLHFDFDVSAVSLFEKASERRL